MGDVSNDGVSATDYTFQQAIAHRNDTSASASAFDNSTGSAIGAANFSAGYDPINPSSLGSTGQSYTVRAGDTLQSIAAAAWGDANLWYLIAETNGLSGTTQLAAGQTLTLPAKVTNLHNTSDTFKVYDPNQALGNLAPAQPAPPVHKSGGCSGAGIIVAIIAVIVTAIVAPYAIAAVSNFATGAAAGTAGALTGSGVAASLAAGTATGAGLGATVVGGALAGAAGSIVSQGVGLATGIQDKFNWGAVALSAIGGGVGAGLGPATSWVQAAVKGAESSAITQGIGLATGLQSKFDWTSVAVAGVASGAGYWAGTSVAATSGRLAGQVAGGAAGLIAGAATRSLITGSDFGDNIMADLPSVIGNTIGNIAAAKINQQALNKSSNQGSANGQGNGQGGDGYVNRADGQLHLGLTAADVAKFDDATGMTSFRQSMADMSASLDQTMAEVMAPSVDNTVAAGSSGGGSSWGGPVQLSGGQLITGGYNADDPSQAASLLDVKTKMSLEDRQAARVVTAEGYLADPKVKAMLDVLSYAEGTQKYGYTTQYGGKSFDGGLSSYFGSKSNPAGRYQIVAGTFSSVGENYLGLSDFSAHSQDLIAVTLLNQAGAITPLLKGDLPGAIRAASGPWAAFPIGPGVDDHSAHTYPNSTKLQPSKPYDQVVQTYNAALTQYLPAKKSP